jgi:hypothetical protein
MINISTETLLNLGQAARLLPPGRQGRPTHPSTILRWITRGVRGCKLEAIRLGGSVYTSREALQRFAELLTANSGYLASRGHDPPHNADITDKELSRLGF